MIIKTYYASQIGAKLNSDVIKGGGTDDTSVLQSVLDKAAGGDEGVHLIIDGAALITGLKLYSNTTIQCLSNSCGFYLADQSNCAVVRNANEVRLGEIIDCNITLDGGTYNQNCANQIHSIPYDDESGYCPSHGLPGFPPSCDLVVDIMFTGVRYLNIKNLVLRDQRTYAAMFRNWEYVNVENVRIELPGRVHGQNQDGFHFFGPGKFLDVRNVGGTTSDDFIALAPDEMDCISTITDVNIDGVHLEDADQGIRILCHDSGFLDRVVIKNVTGTYRSYGFFINPFFPSGVKEGAGYGNIVIDTVNLKSNGIDYDYTAPFLFRVGGRVESLTLRNIHHHCPADTRNLLDVGLQYYTDDVEVKEGNGTKVKSILIDGLHVYENNEKSAATDFIRLQKCELKNLTVRNVEILREGNVPSEGSFIKVMGGAEIESLSVNNLEANGLDKFINQEGGEIKKLRLDGIQIQK